MLIKKPEDFYPSEITPESVYLDRRKFIASGSGVVAASAFGWMPGFSGSAFAANASVNIWQQKMAGSLSKVKPGDFSTNEDKTPLEDILQYNNFYEFGTGKSDPSKNAGKLEIHPWTVKVDGECDKPGNYALEDLVKDSQLEERIYRLRCVEAWSMVIPWVGIPLASLIKKFQPNSNAKYLAFETLYRPEQMPGQKSPFSGIDWPYREGLRIDEAMHPLTIAAVGLYGQTLPNQNGAPIRLVVPWKYGFKSIKSIVRISFVEKMPHTTWSDLAPQEYGFYANVNPNVDHPRWSQKRERRLPGGFLGPKRIDTQMFNGYADQVASLYSGMDLKKYY